MKFVFSLETLLKQKKRLEELALGEYTVAQIKVDESLKKIEQMWTEIQEARENRYMLETSGHNKAKDLGHIEVFVVGHKKRIENEKKLLREFIMIAEEKKEILIEAAKEHKAIQKLKEKKKEEYKKLQNKLEVKRTDDTVNNRFKRNL